jgi:hypothetical protein
MSSNCESPDDVVDDAGVSTELSTRTTVSIALW